MNLTPLYVLVILIRIYSVPSESFVNTLKPSPWGLFVFVRPAEGGCITNHLSEIDVGDCFNVFSTNAIVYFSVEIVLIVGLKGEDFVKFSHFFAFGINS